MIVLKFGGTSVGGADPIQRVGRIVQSVLARDPIVVVSAVGGVTDELFRLSDLALAGEDWGAAFDAISMQHREILGALELEPTLIDDLLDELEFLAGGIASLRELTARTCDRLVSFGERMSCRIVSAHLQSIGVASEPFDAFDVGLVTDSRFGCARPLPGTAERIRNALFEADGVPVITGYIGKNENGVITTLGRGGSDYSASIFGAALGAEEIQIWTDVDGVLTADPRIVQNARHVKRLSFAEASELAFYGAKVIHPATMVPAVEKNIPIRVLNTYRPEFAGTTIVAGLEASERSLKSITSKSHVSVVNVVAAPMALQYGFVEKIARAFAEHEIVVDMIATSEVSVALTTSAGAALGPVVEDLRKFSDAVTVQHDKAQISLVGQEIRERVGFAGEAFKVIADLGLNIELISFGATQINLSFVLGKDHVKEAVRALHDHFFDA